MKNKMGSVYPLDILVFMSFSFFTFRDLDVQNLSTFHDAEDPVFFIFYQKGQKISVITDTGIVSQTMVDSVRNSDVIVLESNHDLSMLENGPYPLQLQHRIKGEYGHLSNDSSAEIMKSIIKSGGEKIILGHLSTTNNTEIIAYDNMRTNLESVGVDVDKDIFLGVAQEYKAGRMIDLGEK